MLRVVVKGDERIYNSGRIDGILVRAKGGNDVVRIAPSVSQWTRIDGGTANDRIRGGSGNDKILARDGEVDFLVVDDDDAVDKDEQDIVL